MPRITYIDKRFAAKTMQIIHDANEIIEDYAADGMKLTLRQLYYQFVAKDLIENHQRSYKRLGNIINNARLAGLIDWTAIEDRTRNLKTNSHWKDPGQIIRATAYSFQMDHWAGQEYHVEVWIEKEALEGVIASICTDLDVPYFACKGYVSQSEMWDAAQRFERVKNQGQIPVVIHLGDHDPSGIDMTRDIQERQYIFAGDFSDRSFILKRIALNMDQIEEFSPPPNPAKETDTRVKGYKEKFGSSSWELDALEPRIMRSLIERTVLSFRDEELYQNVLKQEKEYLAVLEHVATNWKSI